MILLFLLKRLLLMIHCGWPKETDVQNSRRIARFEPIYYSVCRVRRLYSYAPDVRYTIDIQIPWRISRSCFSRGGKPIVSEPSSIRIVCQSAYIEASYNYTYTCIHIFSPCVRDRPNAIPTLRVVYRAGSLRKPSKIFVARSTCCKDVE